jgi:hypothetical protein
MAWESHLLSAAVAPEFLVAGKSLSALIDSDGKYYVYAPSRNGTLLNQIVAFWKQSGRTSDLYLSKVYVVLRGEEIQIALATLTTFWQEIESQPGIVLEATKSRHTPRTTIYAKGFEPLDAEVMYPSDAVIKDGYVYFYREEEVVAWMNAAIASHQPQPDGDDDGETLQYVFNFLKSQLELLQMALGDNLAFVHSEQNPV